MHPTTLGREPTCPLSGTWTFATDPADVGVEEAWYEPGVAWPGASQVTVPHAWQEEEEYVDYTGTAWYRRTFDTTDPADEERTFIRFGAVDETARVWLNGTALGSHAGGYLPFEVDATDVLRTGENVVVVRVHDPADCAERPHGKQGESWYTRVSGPWQPVDLLTVPAVRIARLRATPDLAEDAVRIGIAVADDHDDIEATAREAEIRITDDGTEIATAACPIEDGTGGTTVPLSAPQYWTPETPQLYEVTVTLREGSETLDRVVDTFGMRSLAVVDGELRLNGEPLRIRGALDQGYYPETHYRPTDLETYRQEIETAKELGCNLLRKHIKPAHPRFLELADRRGILVWAEPANPSVDTAASRAAVREQLLGMIDRDFNRPSVVIWSLYNEEWGLGGHEDEASLWTDAEKQEYLAELAQVVRDRDPTRSICDNSGWAHVATDINDYHEYFPLPDRAAAWDERLDEIIADPADNYATTEPDGSDDPIVISEFGTWGLPSVRGLRAHYGGTPHWFDREGSSGLRRPVGIEERFADSAVATMFEDLEALAAAWQRRQAEAVAAQIERMRERDAVSGYVLTEFTDVEWESNGLLDYSREPKAVTETFEAVNAPVACWLDPASYAVAAGDRLTADIVVANDTRQALEVNVAWRTGDEAQRGREVVGVDPTSTRRCPGAIEIRAPDVNELATMTLTVAVPDRTLERTATIAVVPTASDAAGTLYVDDSTLRQAVRERGHTIVDDAGAAETWITTDPADAARQFAAEGGSLLVLPDHQGAPPTGAPFSYRTLPEGASWRLCASLIVQSTLPALNTIPGWAFAELYPMAVVTDIEPDDAVSVAYADGWLTNTGAITLMRPYGDGRITACTLQVTAAYGDHPVATAVLDRLIRRHG